MLILVCIYKYHKKLYILFDQFKFRSMLIPDFTKSNIVYFTFNLYLNMVYVLNFYGLFRFQIFDVTRSHREISARMVPLKRVTNNKYDYLFVKDKRG
jgi:hypothetical protein